MVCVHKSSSDEVLSSLTMCMHTCSGLIVSIQDQVYETYTLFMFSCTDEQYDSTTFHTGLVCFLLQERFIEDVWLLLRVVVMLLPLPVFWALFDQQVIQTPS